MTLNDFKKERAPLPAPFIRDAIQEASAIIEAEIIDGGYEEEKDDNARMAGMIEMHLFLFKCIVNFCEDLNPGMKAELEDRIEEAEIFLTEWWAENGAE
jgi:hypothetical protein